MLGRLEIPFKKGVDEDFKRELDCLEGGHSLGDVSIPAWCHPAGGRGGGLAAPSDIDEQQGRQPGAR